MWLWHKLAPANLWRWPGEESKLQNSRWTRFWACHQERRTRNDGSWGLTDLSESILSLAYLGADSSVQTLHHLARLRKKNKGDQSTTLPFFIFSESLSTQYDIIFSYDRPLCMTALWTIIKLYHSDHTMNYYTMIAGTYRCEEDLRYWQANVF